MEKYKHLMLQMNLFYHDVTKDQQKLKPSVLEEGQVRQHLTHHWIEGRLGRTCACLYFPLGLCGVLVCAAVMVPGRGGVAHCGLCVLYSSLPAGGPWRTSSCFL